jgi:hypothetical protein
MGNNKSTDNTKDMKPKFPMVKEFMDVKTTTEKNKKALECVISAIEKYNAACAKAFTNLSSDLQKCKLKLEEGKPHKPNVKK